jgi:hypothetical protein
MIWNFEFGLRGRRLEGVTGRCWAPFWPFQWLTLDVRGGERPPRAPPLTPPKSPRPRPPSPDGVMVLIAFSFVRRQREGARIVAINTRAPRRVNGLDALSVDTPSAKLVISCNSGNESTLTPTVHTTCPLAS